MANPFKELGFEPEFLRNISDEQIKTAIKYHFRLLAQNFHPDKKDYSDKLSRTRSAEKSEKLQLILEAFRELDNPELYHKHKDDFLKKQGGMTKKIEMERNLAKLEVEQLSKNFLSYLGSFPEIGLSDKGILMRILDSTRKEYMPNRPGDREYAESFFYEMGLSPSGEIYVIDKKKKILLKNKKLIGTIDGIMVSNIGGIQNLFGSYKKREGTNAFPERYSKSRFDDFVSRSRVLDNSCVYKILKYIKPELREDSFLFATNKIDGNNYFSLEGKIVRLENLSRGK